MSDDTADYRLFRVLDLDAHFRNSPDAVLLNKIDFTRSGYAEALNTKLYHQRSEMNFVASCDCGYYADNFYIGATCPKCKSKATPPLSAGRGNLPHTTWISIPDSVPGVLHPTFYRVLSKWLKYSRTDNYIDTILNPAKPLPAALADVVTGRGFAYLHDNFDVLMATFANLIKKPGVAHIQRFIERYRHLAFVRYLPAMASVLHPITAADEATETSRQYTDKDSQYFLQAVHQLSFIEFNPKKLRRPELLDIKLFEAYKAYMQYLTAIVDRRLSHKSSLLRRHMFGARYHWSARAVITPIPGPHHYDEIHIPWSVGVNTFRVHILGRLVRRHQLPINEAVARHKKAEAVYDPLIDQIMKELIAESPYPGIPCWANRNPSLRKGATQLVFITKIKTNVEDTAMGISVLILRAPNGDFDGDSFNLLVLLENAAVEKYLRMHPSTTYLSTNTPSTSRDIVLPKQPTILLAAWQGLV